MEWNHMKAPESTNSVVFRDEEGDVFLLSIMIEGQEPGSVILLAEGEDEYSHIQPLHGMWARSTVTDMGEGMEGIEVNELSAIDCENVFTELFE